MPTQVVGPRTLAELKTKLAYALDYTGSLSEIPLSVLTASTEVTCQSVAGETRMSATDSDTLADPALCQPANAQTFGASNAEARLGLFRYFDSENRGAHNTEYDRAYQDLGRKGREAVFFKRVSGKNWDEPWEVGDELSVFRVIADNPQEPQDRTGYVKRLLPFAVQDFEINAVVVAGG